MHAHVHAHALTHTLMDRYGAIQVLRNEVEGGRVSDLSGKNRYEDVWFNVISVTRGWVGVKFPGKKRYVTLEWPLCTHPMFDKVSVC